MSLKCIRCKSTHSINLGTCLCGVCTAYDLSVKVAELEAENKRWVLFKAQTNEHIADLETQCDVLTEAAINMLNLEAVRRANHDTDCGLPSPCGCPGCIKLRAALDSTDKPKRGEE